MENIVVSVYCLALQQYRPSY